MSFINNVWFINKTLLNIRCNIYLIYLLSLPSSPSTLLRQSVWQRWPRVSGQHCQQSSNCQQEILNNLQPESSWHAIFTWTSLLCESFNVLAVFSSLLFSEWHLRSFSKLTLKYLDWRCWWGLSNLSRGILWNWTCTRPSKPSCSRMRHLQCLRCPTLTSQIYYHCCQVTVKSIIQWPHGVLALHFRWFAFMIISSALVPSIFHYWKEQYSSLLTHTWTDHYRSSGLFFSHTNSRTN